MKLRKVVRKAVANYKLYRSTKLSKTKACKKLTCRLKAHSGRNNSGRITVRHQFSGRKKLYRRVSFIRKILDIEGVVKSIEYDPNRTAFIALVEYADKQVEYILATEDMKINDVVIASANNVPIVSGNATRLQNIPKGTQVCNIELVPNKGGKVARAAGTFAEMIDVLDRYAILRLSSGFMIRVHNNCFATIGVVSNIEMKNKPMYKAGHSYYKGIRPTVRGVAMNPVDHPHGGGEGRTGTKRHPVTYKCKIAKGVKTRSKRSINSKFIIRRKKEKK